MPTGKYTPVTPSNIAVSLCLIVSSTTRPFFNGIGTGDYNSYQMGLLKFENELRREKCHRKDTVERRT